jgi:hypothetical protein
VKVSAGHHARLWRGQLLPAGCGAKLPSAGPGSGVRGLPQLWEGAGRGRAPRSGTRTRTPAHPHRVRAIRYRNTFGIHTVPSRRRCACSASLISFSTCDWSVARTAAAYSPVDSSPRTALSMSA